jgi:hypothetical protein
MLGGRRLHRPERLRALCVGWLREDGLQRGLGRVRLHLLALSGGII